MNNYKIKTLIFMSFYYPSAHSVYYTYMIKGGDNILFTQLNICAF